MRDDTKFYIDGAWLEATGLPTLDVINPATERVAGAHRAGDGRRRRPRRGGRQGSVPQLLATRQERLDLLQSVLRVYMARRQPARISQCDCTDFLAHGMGLVSHEAPRLTAKGPVPYDDPDARLPLEVGMVVSIETTMKHPKRGFIKLEDTVAVTPTGYEIFGEGGRGWNLGGTALA